MILSCRLTRTKITRRLQDGQMVQHGQNWLALSRERGNQPLDTLVYWGFIPSFPTKAQLENAHASPEFMFFISFPHGKML